MPKTDRKSIALEGGKINRNSNFTIALSLFILLVAIYSLTYSGTFITDDEHVLISRTLSLAFDGQLNDSRVYGNSRVYALSNTSQIYAAQGVNIEPGQAFVGSAFARLSVILDVGHVQTIFLLNIWVTALTAVCIFCAVLFQGYSRLTALLSALFFGLGTMAWPYSKAYFRDSLAMLFLSIAWVSAICLIKARKVSIASWVSWFGLVAGLVAGTLTKNTVIVAFPVLLSYVLIRTCRDNSTNGFLHRKNKKYLFFLVGGVLLVLLFWAIFLPPEGILARFSPSYYLSVLYKLFASPHPKLFEALTGPHISPGKSIFLYSPCLILSILGLIKSWKRSWPAWFYLLLLIVSQALFFDWEWWGFINWGLRFVLPAIPPLIIASASTVDIWLRTLKGRISLFGLGLLSLASQLIGILPPMKQYYIDMLKISSQSLETIGLWNPTFSPWLWHIKWIISGGSWDLAAVRVGVQSIPIILGWVVVICIALLGLQRTSRISLPGFGLLLIVGITVFMLVTYKFDPAYSSTRADLELAQETISQHISDDDLVLIKSYGTPAWHYWVNWADPDYQWTSLPFFFPKPSLIKEYNQTQDPEIVLDEITISLFQELPGSYQRVWLLLPDDTPGVNMDIEIDWLEEISISSEEWVSPGNDIETRLYLLEFAPNNPISK